MEFELVFWYALKFSQAMLRVAPETLNAVNMVAKTGRKFTLPVVDTKMLLVVQVDQAIITTPAVGVNNALYVGLTSNNGLQRNGFGIRNDFGVYFPIALENTENDGFPTSAPATFSLDPTRAKVNFVCLKLTSFREIGLCLLKNTNAEF